MTSPSAVIDATPIGTRRDHPSAAYVVAGGENAAGPWTLELRPQTEPGYLTNVQLELTTVKGVGVTAGGPFTVNEDHPIEQAGGDPVFGAVVKEADGVELHLEEGTPTIPAQLVPLPPSMPFDFDLFFASNDTDVAATAVRAADRRRRGARIDDHRRTGTIVAERDDAASTPTGLSSCSAHPREERTRTPGARVMGRVYGAGSSRIP